MSVGEHLLRDYNHICLYDFYVEDLYFYQDDVEYYSRVNDRKWYLQQTGEDSNILDYLQVTIDEEDQLCYRILLSEPKKGKHLNNSEIGLFRCQQTAARTIKGAMLGQRTWRTFGQVTTAENNIPLLTISLWNETKEKSRSCGCVETAPLFEAGCPDF